MDIQIQLLYFQTQIFNPPQRQKWREV